MDRKLSLAVIVPVYNEQYLVEASLHRLEVLRESPWLERVKVIVVNDASPDQTAEVLAKFREQLGGTGFSAFEWVFVDHPENQGKGSAIQTAVQYVDTDLAVIHDAALENHPEDLLKTIRLSA